MPSFSRGELITASKLNDIARSTMQVDMSMETETGERKSLEFYFRSPGGDINFGSFSNQTSRLITPYPEMTVKIERWVVTGSDSRWASVASVTNSMGINLVTYPLIVENAGTILPAGHECWIRITMSFTHPEYNRVYGKVEANGGYFPARSQRGQRLVLIDYPENSGNTRDIGAVLTTSRVNSGYCMSTNYFYNSDGSVTVVD